MRGRKLDIFVLIIALLIVAIAPITAAYAGEWTALYGVSRFTPQSDGTWWQEPFPHALDMTDQSFGIRYDISPSENGWSYGAGFMRLGRVSSVAKAVALDGMTDNDGGYNSKTKACNGVCWPLSDWYGKGDVQGVFALASKHYGDFSVEGGLYLYYPRWRVDIPNWIGCRDCQPQYIVAQHHQHWQVGPMFGIRWKPSQWSLNLSAWQTQTQGDSNYNPYSPALYHGLTYNLSIGYSW